MIRKNRNSSRRKRQRGRGPFLIVTILAIIVMVGGFLAVSTYRERQEREAAIEKTRRPLATERRRMPDRKPVPAVNPALENYTAAVTSSPLSEKATKRRTNLKPGTLAIVIDDMGTSRGELDSLTALGIPITFSIIPQLPHAAEVAKLAHERGYEVMLHLPMEPKGYPQQRLEVNGLLVGLSDEEIDRRIRSYLKTVPYVAGANNHMGSRFTEDSAKMLPVMQVLKEKRLFYLDSKTTPLSVGYSLAHELGLRTATRNVFLDNVQEVGAIRKQLEEAARVARKRGFAVAICHPHQTTITALAQTLPILQAEGITFVKLSQVVE